METIRRSVFFHTETLIAETNRYLLRPQQCGQEMTFSVTGTCFMFKHFRCDAGDDLPLKITAVRNRVPYILKYIFDVIEYGITL